MSQPKSAVFEARRQLARAAELEPGDAGVLGEYSRALETAGDTAGARALRARIAKLPPPPPPEESPKSEDSPE